MQWIRTSMVFATMAFVLSACETDTALDDVGTLWGDKSRAEIAEEEARQAAIENKVPVMAVQSVEIGQTRTGYLVSAFGTAPGLGYSLPELRARRSGEPSLDGFIEYDFVATVPSPALDLPPGTTRTRSIRADLLVKQGDIRNLRGIRVFAQQGGVQVGFAASAQAQAAQAGQATQ